MSGIFSRPGQRYVGIDIGVQAIKVVELSRSHGTFKLQAYAIEPLSPQHADTQTRADPKSVAHVLLEVLARAGVVARDAVVAVPDAQVIGKTFEVQAGLSPQELELHVWLEAEQYVPYALEEAALDFVIEDGSANNPGQVRVLLVVCSQEILAWYQALLKGAGLKAQVIDVQTHALARAVGWMLCSAAQVPETVAVVEFATETTQMSIVQQDRVIYACELLFGASDPGAETFGATVVQHVLRGLERFAGSGINGPVTAIILAGVAASHPGLKQCLEARLGMPAHVANPFACMGLNPELEPDALFCNAPMLLTACGLALRGFD